MLFMTNAFANPVTQGQAMQTAKAFLQKRGMQMTDRLELTYQGRQTTDRRQAPAKDAFYYVFNNGQNAGFVIVAGDDCAEDVLGYADQGTFDPDNIPENMNAFLQSYAEEIEMARARSLTTTGNDTEVEVARKVVAPLIETHWNQYDPYNQLCYNNAGEQCVTGCVATALAQVMYYYRWPEDYTNAIPAYTANIYGDEYDELPSTTFEWNKMKPVYINTGEDDEEAEAAVAKLMWYCGHAVEMNYSPGGSGGYESMIPYALKNYFNYPGNPQWLRRRNYTTEQWDEMIYHELKYGRPVLYGAQTSGGSGHEFICDGYDGHGLYHINWGWGGQSDGYFRLQALRPSSQGAGGSNGSGGYSLDQDAIIGMSGTAIGEEETIESSDNSVVKTVALKVTGDLEATYSPSSGLNTQASISYSMSNAEVTADLGFGLFQDDEMIQQKTFIESKTLYSGYTYGNSGTLLYGLGKNLADGNYQVKGLGRVSGTEEWTVNQGSDLIYINVVISGGKVYYTNVAKEPATEITVTKVEQRFDTDDTQIRVYVKNTGETDYSGKLYLLIDGNLKGYEGVYVSEGDEDFVDLFFSASAGTVKLVVATNAAGTNTLYTNEAFVLTANNSTKPSLTCVGNEFKNMDSDNNIMYSALLDGTVTLRNDNNEDFDGNVTLKLDVITQQKGNSIYYTPYRFLIPASIKVGESKNVVVGSSCLTIGDRFRYTVFGPDGATLAGSSSFYTVKPGIVYWKGTGEREAQNPSTTINVPADVAAVSLEDLGNLSGYTITGGNENTIYYINAGGNLDKNNVVVARQAGTITLDESNDFFVPLNFSAAKISYQKLPQKGADGKNGWETITLPFSVQNVTSAGKTVDWYHGNDTEEKDFWVREFKQVVGNEVQFADAGVWVPNVPYIIAVPGNHWGAQYDMTNKALVFSATDVRVEKSTVSACVSDNYEFVGLTGNPHKNNAGNASQWLAGMQQGNYYFLNDAGNAFVKMDNGSSETDWMNYRNQAYFTINNKTIDPPARLNIGTFDPDGILSITTDGQARTVDIYSINGMKVGTATTSYGQMEIGDMPKGIYIVNGKKIVVR